MSDNVNNDNELIAREVEKLPSYIANYRVSDMGNMPMLTPEMMAVLQELHDNSSMLSFRDEQFDWLTPILSFLD